MSNANKIPLPKDVKPVDYIRKALTGKTSTKEYRVLDIAGRKIIYAAVEVMDLISRHREVRCNIIEVVSRTNDEEYIQFQSQEYTRIKDLPTTCPDRILDLLTPCDDRAERWRARCRNANRLKSKRLTNQKTQTKLQPIHEGDTVMFEQPIGFKGKRFPTRVREFTVVKRGNVLRFTTPIYNGIDFRIGPSYRRIHPHTVIPYKPTI